MQGTIDETRTNTDQLGKSDNETNAGRASGDSSGDKPASFFPEYEPIEPGVERIDTAGNDTAGTGGRRTKSGRIDRRTRAGRTGTPPEKEVSGNLGKLSIQELLMGIHSMGAFFLGIEELELDDQEAKKMGEAVTELGNVYGKSISPKTMAWANLASVCGMVYGSRLIAYRHRINSMPKPVIQPGPQKVPPRPAPPAAQGQP